MTYQEALAHERRWYKRVTIIHMYHIRMCRSRKWSLRKTAAKLGISVGNVSEAIKLSTAILDKPELEGLKRAEALEQIK